MLFTLLSQNDFYEETTERTNFIINYLENINWQEIAIALLILLVQLIVVVLLFMLIKMIGKKIIDRTFQSNRFVRGYSPSRKKTLQRLSKHVFNGIIYFLLTFTILELFGVPVGSLLAGAGVIGLALSLGAQDFVADIVNGFAILVEKQLDIGDTVVINDIWGDVIDTNLKTTIVKTFDGAYHYIPNRKIDIISNRSRGEMRALVVLHLFANTDFEKVKDIIKSVNDQKLKDYPNIKKDIEYIVEPNDKGQVTMRIPLFTAHGEEYDTMIDFYESYLNALNEAGVPLPSNTFDIQKID